MLGTTPDAYGQTWHLPIDPHRLTYAEIIAIASDVLGRDLSYRTVPEAAFRALGLFTPAIKESNELLPRYRQDNLFDSTRSAARFPDFEVTSYREGITRILTEDGARP